MVLNHFELQVLTIDRLDKSHLVQVQELLAAGAKWIQYRNKLQSYHEYKDELLEISQLCKEADCTLIVNDSLDGLHFSKAQGIHLGKNDLDPQRARNVLGSKKIIGVTVNSLKDAQRVVQQGVANYVGLGPFNHTETKANLAPVLTVDELQECLEVLQGIPVVLIGGISQENYFKAQSIGTQGIAISSAISGADSLADALHYFQQNIQKDS